MNTSPRFHSCLNMHRQVLKGIDGCPHSAVVHLYRSLYYEGLVSKHRLLMDDLYRQVCSPAFNENFCGKLFEFALAVLPKPAVVNVEHSGRSVKIEMLNSY